MKKVMIILLIILIIVGSVGYFMYKNNKEQDPFELEWIRIYYDYLKENKEKLNKREESVRYYRTNEKIQFCKIQGIEKPVMLYNYEELGQAFTNIFYIGNNSVNSLQMFKKDFTVEYLFDIENNTYDYYVREVNEDSEKYYNIYESIKANEEQFDSDEIIIDDVFEFKIGERYSLTTLDGRVLEVPKFDQKFVKTDAVENKWEYISINSYEDEIKEEFRNAIENMESELTDAEIAQVNKKVSEVKSKKDEMVKALEEIQQKQKEEEERKKAEEEARIKAEEEAKKKAEEQAREAEEQAKKAEEEAKKAAEEKKRQEESQARKLYIKIWNI